MSRTFRRKNYETTRRYKSGNSVHPTFPQTDVFVESCWHNPDLYGHGGRWVFREPTKQEFDKEYWRIHGESKHSKAWGPDRYYRKRHKNAMKKFNDREWNRYLHANGEYELMFIVRHRHSAIAEYRWW